MDMAVPIDTESDVPGRPTHSYPAGSRRWTRRHAAIGRHLGQWANGDLGWQLLQ